MPWDIIDTGVSDPEINMQIDQDLLDGLKANSACILHLYEWTGCCATHGYFIDPSKYLTPHGVRKHALKIARRPTGGGIIFHAFDLAFSALVPSSYPSYSVNTLDNYAIVNNVVAEAIKSFMGNSAVPSFLQQEEKPLMEDCRHFCMAKPTIYDVMIDGRKVGGGAQRRTKQGFLHQGSIALTIPGADFLQDILQPGVIQAMKQNSFPLLQNDSQQDLSSARVQLKKLLIKAFMEQL